jgi:hypothetical protein
MEKDRIYSVLMDLMRNVREIDLNIRVFVYRMCQQINGIVR